MISCMMFSILVEAGDASCQFHHLSGKQELGSYKPNLEN